MPPFDHDEHCRLLEEAEKELNAAGKTKLATAVSRARAIHFDEMSRIANAQQQIRMLKKLRDKLTEAIGTLEDYTTKPGAPWLSPELDLFPKEKDKE